MTERLSSSPHIAAANDYVYIANAATNRIERYAYGGVFAGWIGTISSTFGLSPAACASAGVGSFTPDWCFGGASDTDSSAHFYGPRDVSVVGNTLIVADSLDKLVKIDGTPGAVRFLGWTGAVGQSPADVPTSCVSGTLPAAGGVTNGWCLGGNPASGIVDGAFSYLQAVAQDLWGNIYVLSDNRATKLAPTGNSVGWVGTIAGSVIGGSCDGASGQLPHWCTGGTLSTALTSSAMSITYDSTENLLYVGDIGMVQKFDGPTGAYLGWAGEVAFTPTGGGTGCTTAALAQLTPSWCTGGDRTRTSKHDNVRADAIVAGTDYLYLADHSSGRVTRLSKHEK